MINKFMLICVFWLYFAAVFTLQIETDIRVYKEAYNNYIYLSDTGYEYLQILFKGMNFPFEYLQVLLILLSIILIWQFRSEFNSVIYLLGPVVFIGVFNSIRQSFAVTFLYFAIEFYKSAQKKAGLHLIYYICISGSFLILALSFHKGVVFILLFYAGVNLIRILLRNKISLVDLTIVILLILLIFVNFNWLNYVFIRYIAYLDINNSFDRGVISQLKIYFWWLSLFVDYYFGRLQFSKTNEMMVFLSFKVILLTTITFASFLDVISPELVSRILLLFMYFSFWYILSNGIIRSNLYHMIYVASPSSLGIAFAILY